MISTHISTDGLALVACVVIVVVYSIVEKFWHTHKRVRSQTWPLRFAQVTKAAVFEDRHEATLTLWYSYPVPDEPYPIPAQFQKAFSSRHEAQHWADALSDKTIPVHVDPANSWKSELWDSDLEPIVVAAARR